VSGYLTIEYASLTDVGVRRSHNQDNHATLPASDAGQWAQRGHLFVVADGMGAHAVGELASKIAVDNIPHIYIKHAQEGPSAALRKAIQDTNTAIHTRGQQNREFEGMGTTGTALLLGADGAWVGHVGDSRAYRVRRGRIEQLSFDHSLVWELARRQGIKPEELQGIPSNVIVRSLGPEPVVQVDIEGPHPIKPGDIYVLCSDGLSGPVSDREIGAVVSALSPKEACRFLIDLANLQGGPDNITMVVVRVLGEGGKPEDSQQSVAEATRRRWRTAIPWPLASLLAGIVLALAAIGLTFAHFRGGMPVFLLAAVALGAGFVGLFFQSRAENSLAEEDEPSSIKVHRRTPCAIDMPLVDKLRRAESLLEERIREKQWAMDGENLKLHHEQAEKFLKAKSLTDAFREYCLAMRPLSEAIERQRHKEEKFQPVWDRYPEPTPGSSSGKSSGKSS
jgi:PPM family protein phosphatase